MVKRKKYKIRWGRIFAFIILVVCCILMIFRPFSKETTDNYKYTLQKNIDKVLNNSSKLIDVPYISQMPDFPTGCEAVSTVMLLNFYNENITVDSFIENFLSCNNDFYSKDGMLYGPNPNEFFVGDPKTNNSYGCYSPVIEKALKKYCKSDLSVYNTSGTSLKEICSQYIDNDIPVLIWASIRMSEITDGDSWYINNDEYFTWKRNEHCLVLVGYDRENYYFNDPMDGKNTVFTKESVEKAFNALEMQSIVINKK